MERRVRTTKPFDDFEVEERSGQPTRIRGYAARFYDPNDDGTEFVSGRVRERISRSAFDAALERRDDAVAVFNHDRSLLLGRVSAGNLKLEKDSLGLRYEVELANTSVARDLVVNIRAGNIRGSSFAFTADADSWDHSDADVSIRTLESLTLHDVSPCTDPAYISSSVELNTACERSRELERLKKLAQLEEMLI